jgi:hypothetical protein
LIERHRMNFDTLKAHIAAMRQVDPAYAEWARTNYRRILAVFFQVGE